MGRFWQARFFFYDVGDAKAIDIVSFKVTDEVLVLIAGWILHKIHVWWCCQRQRLAGDGRAASARQQVRPRDQYAARRRTPSRAEPFR